jgi:hypothetical protein
MKFSASAQTYCIALLFTLLLPAETYSEAKEAQAKPSGAKLHFFSGLWDNVADTVWGSPTNIAAWVTVAGSTSIIVNTDLDRNINNAVGRSPVWSRPVDVGFLAGGQFCRSGAAHRSCLFTAISGVRTNPLQPGPPVCRHSASTAASYSFWKWAAGRPRPVYDARLDDSPARQRVQLQRTRAV